MSKHGEHQPGTAGDCVKCTKIAYEPSWYAVMLAFEERNLDTVLHLADRAEVVTTQTGPLWT
jgi:hypothetical protein